MYVGFTAGASAGELVAEVNFDESLKKDIDQFYKSISDRQSTSSIITTVSLLLLVVSWIGLFKFWKPARVSFCIYLVLAYLIGSIFDFRFEGLPVENQLFAFYCKVLMDQPGALAKILGTIIIAFDTIVVLVIFSTYGRDLFVTVDEKNYT